MIDASQERLATCWQITRFPIEDLNPKVMGLYDLPGIIRHGITQGKRFKDFNTTPKTQQLATSLLVVFELKLNPDPCACSARGW
jgi:hypothetical protein